MAEGTNVDPGRVVRSLCRDVAKRMCKSIYFTLYIESPTVRVAHGTNVDYGRGCVLKMKHWEPQFEDGKLFATNYFVDVFAKVIQDDPELLSIARHGAEVRKNIGNEQYLLTK